MVHFVAAIVRIVKALAEVVNRRPVAAVHVDVQQVTPVVESCHAPQGQKSHLKVSEMARVIAGENEVADDGKDVEEDEENEKDEDERGGACDQGFNDDAQLRDDPHDPHQAQQPKHRQDIAELWSPGNDENVAQRHDDEVEL